MLIYYVLNSQPDKPIETEFVDDLISLLYDAKADFISDSQRLELNLPSDYIVKLRRLLSRSLDRVPLYDIRSNHVFLIYWQNVYNRILIDNYRFVNQRFQTELLSINAAARSDSDVENIRLLSYYDLDVLEKTYAKIFYRSFVFNSYITDCRRPSFYSGMDHISPYYNINELNYLAFDWNIIDKITMDQDELENICQKIKQYDIPSQTLIDHQIYIFNSKAIGLVKNYSLSGSYYMNVYLRKTRCILGDLPQDKCQNINRNLYLENQIAIMIRLIKNAPAFVKQHTVYRFVQSDEYLRELRVGDIYQDTSFMSTTRNPVYYNENNAFGYILIKITLPSDIRGVGLCIESYSNFPREEEIILAPGTRYRLDSITDTQSNQEFHTAFNINLHKRYNFSWAGNDMHEQDVKLDVPGAVIPTISRVDFTEIITDNSVKYLNMADRLEYFRTTYLNVNRQFTSQIANNEYTFVVESYDSTGVYGEFFYYKTADGIMISTKNPKFGNINLLIEIGPEIHINYYFRYSVTDPSSVVNLDSSDWIAWLSALAFVVGSKYVVIHSNYMLLKSPNDSIERSITKTRFTFSQDVYFYMKFSRRMYQFMEVTPQFDYYRFDYLKQEPVDKWITSSDKNELYRIYKSSGLINMFDFYIYIVENYPKFVSDIENYMNKIFDYDTNPFTSIAYTLNAFDYLYNRNIITTIPTNEKIKKGSFKKLISDRKIPKFKNRLRTYIRNQSPVI